MDSRQKHNWPFWFAAGTIALPVLYVASFGPACWLGDRQLLPVRLAKSIYRPLALVVMADECGEALHEWLYDYGLLGRPAFPPEPWTSRGCFFDTSTANQILYDQ